VSDPNLSDERIDEIWVDATVDDHGDTTQEVARWFARAILSEGTASLKAENEHLKKELQEQALRYLSEQGQWIEETAALRTQLAEAQKDVQNWRELLKHADAEQMARFHEKFGIPQAALSQTEMRQPDSGAAQGGQPGDGGE
jgi:uncharacterized Ntn-hydrolase superfamily protein